ncbi:MAG TPA: hypothetical protein VF584_13030 [Longimicrobium sp.]|jgi:hypothetical protein
MLIRAAVFVCAAILLSAEAAHAQQSARRTWVIPHVLERPGRVATELHMVNLDRGATVEVSVFANDGQPMKSRSGQAVCNPCRISFTASPKQVFSLRDRIEAAGGYAGEPMSGYIVFTATAPAAVNLQSFVVNSHSSAASLSVFGSAPEEVRSTLNP